MCGRYFRRSDKQQIAEAFRLGLPTTFEIMPSFNVAPQTFQPVVRLSSETGERDGREIEMRLDELRRAGDRDVGVNVDGDALRPHQAAGFGAGRAGRGRGVAVPVLGHLGLHSL